MGVLLTAICLPNLTAQHLQAGLRAGFTVSNLSKPGDLYEQNELKTGFGGGLALRYPVSQSFGIQSGLYFEQKGFRGKRESELGEGSMSGTYEYITVPVLAEGSLPLKGTVRLYGVAGPYGAVKTQAEHAVTWHSGDATGEVPSWKVNKGDGGLVFGGGIMFPSGDMTIEAGFRYSMGLAEVTSASPDDRNKSMLFSVGLYF